MIWKVKYRDCSEMKPHTRTLSEISSEAFTKSIPHGRHEHDTHHLTGSSQKPVRRMSTPTRKSSHGRLQPTSVSTGPLYLLARGCLYARFLKKQFFSHKNLHLKDASHCHPIFTPGTHPPIQTPTAWGRGTRSPHLSISSSHSQKQPPRPPFLLSKAHS